MYAGGLQHVLTCNWLQVVNPVEGSIQFLETWQGIEPLQSSQATMRYPEDLEGAQ